MIDLSWIKKAVIEKRYQLSGHAEIERANDEISIRELLESINCGIILEQYQDTGRGESCLIAGFTTNGKPVHSVLGERDNKAVIITVYIPKPPHFKNIYERGEDE